MLGVLLLLGLAGAGLAGIAYASIDIPAPRAESQAKTTTVYYADGTTELGTFAGAVNRRPLDPDQMPQVMKDAAVAAEDRSFYENKGVSLTGLGRAIYGVATGHENLGGGSTITQQFVKNTYLSSDRSYARKAREAVIAFKLDQRRTKDEILTGYLNTIYFGRGASGVATAAQAYFGVDASQLTPQQAALLMGIVPSPSAWDPRKDPEKAQQRYQYVLDGMVQLGYLDDATAATSPQMPETVDPTQRGQQYAGPNGYILAAAKKEAMARTGMDEDAIESSGLSIVTTIDPQKQQAAVDAMNDTSLFPTKGRPERLQAGLVSIDPATGGVVAMYGGADYLSRNINNVTGELVQPGSTFKPFALVAGLEKGISLRETFSGRSPQYFKGYLDDEGKPKAVENFGGESLGRINLIEATEKSVNTVYVALNQRVGPEATAQAAVRAGLPQDSVKPVPSNVLGTSSVHPIDMAEAYATFAARGVHHETHLVGSVAQRDKVVYQADAQGQRVFDERVMADATYAMQGVVQSGSGKYATRLGRPAAGKTGTTQDNQAAWFSGFTPQLETSVVLFNVDEKGAPVSIPRFGGYKEIVGGTIPVRLWTRYMESALAGTPEADFPKPAYVGRATSSATRTAEPSDEPTSGSDDEPSSESTGGSSPEPSAESTDGSSDSSGGSGDASGDGSSADSTGSGSGDGSTTGSGDGSGSGSGSGSGGSGGSGRNRT